MPFYVSADLFLSVSFMVSEYWSFLLIQKQDWYLKWHYNNSDGLITIVIKFTSLTNYFKSNVSF